MMISLRARLLLAAPFRLVLFWLYFTGTRCTGVVAAAGPVSFSTVSPTTSSLPPTSTPSSSHPMMSTSSASAVPSPTQFFINAIKNMTTCTPGNITWTYTGSSANLLLSITNLVVSNQSGNPARRQITVGKNVSVTLADIDATSTSWTWPKVNVSQGWYQLQGTVNPFSAVSTFFINNGSDTSCLLSSSSLPATGSSSSTASAASGNYASVHSGEIIGIVLGALAGLGIIAVVIAYYLRRRRLPRENKRHRQIKENVGRWDSLRSNSSTAKSPSEGNTGDISTAHSDATELTNEVLQISVADVKSNVGEKIEPYRSNRMSQRVFPSDSMDSPPSSYKSHTFLHSLSDPLTPGDTHHRRRSELNFEQQAARIRSSMESSMYLRTDRSSLPVFPRSPTSPGGRGEYPPSPAATAFPHRGRDGYPPSPSNTAFPHRGRDGYPPSPSNTTFPHRGRDEYPPSPVTPTSPTRGRDEYLLSLGAVTSTSRSPSASTATRRTSRKAVPHYDLLELRGPTKVSQESQSMVTSDDSPSSPHDLSHRTSFGNYPRMHYLIPDMPPANQ